jgi:hypothetical protein
MRSKTQLCCIFVDLVQATCNAHYEHRGSAIDAKHCTTAIEQTVKNSSARNENNSSENWARNGREIPLKMHYSISTQTNLDDSAGGRSDTRPKVGAFLGNRASDSGTLDFTFGVYDDASVV